MTGVLVATVMAVAGTFALALWHSYRWHLTRRVDRAVAERWDAQLALVGQLVPLRQVDEAYALELARAGEAMGRPFDYALSGFGEEGLRAVLDERRAS